MEPIVIVLVLCAAVMHAVWNTILKVGDDRLMTMAVVIGVGGMLSPLLMLAGPPPLPESCPMPIPWRAARRRSWWPPEAPGSPASC